MSTTHPNERPNVFNTALGGDPDAMSAALARNWWAVALRGLAGVIFGLIALFLPGITMLALVLMFSAYMLVDGAFAIVSAMRRRRRGISMPGRRMALRLEPSRSKCSCSSQAWPW